MPIDPIAKRDTFLAEPYQHINNAVTIQNGGATVKHYRIIGVAKIEDGSNLIYFDVFDEAGQLIHPSWVEWNWLENSGGNVLPAKGDKPPGVEPSGNIGMIGGVHIWLEVKDFVSERVVFPPPDDSSWYVVFQLVDISEPPPEPEPEPPPDPPPGETPAIPVDLEFVSATDTTITLSWSVSDQLAERFKVSWSKNMIDWQELIAQSMEATIPNLLPDSLYLIRVQSVNPYGESTPAELPARTAKAPDNPPEPDPPPGNIEFAGTYQVAPSPQHVLVIPLTGNVQPQDKLDTEQNSYILMDFSLTDLKSIVAGMEARGEQLTTLGLRLVLRQEYKP